MRAIADMLMFRPFDALAGSSFSACGSDATGRA
jgi:hypothetical protein